MAANDTLTLAGGFLHLDSVDVHGILRIEALHLHAVRDVLAAHDGDGPYGIIDDDVGINAGLLQIQETVVGPGIQVAGLIHERGLRDELLDDVGQPDFFIQSRHNLFV